MRAISKGPEPASLASHRAMPHSDYSNYAAKDDIRRSMVAEQHGLCCYCMSRVRASNAEMKIEHWLSQSGFPGTQLDYRNLLAACKGGEGKPAKQQHCDALKGDGALMWNPANAAHVIETRVQYLFDGTIRSPDPAFDDQINSLIGLNQPFLKNNRKGALDNLLLWWRSGPRTTAQVRSKIAALSPAAGDHDPFSPVAIWYLKQRIAA